MCFIFRNSKSHSFAGFESCVDFRSIAGMYFFTADPFMHVLEVFAKVIYRFGWSRIAKSSWNALIIGCHTGLVLLLPATLAHMHVCELTRLSYVSTIFVSRIRPNGQISPGKHCQCIGKWIYNREIQPRCAAEFPTALKTRGAGSSWNLEKKHMFLVIKKTWNYIPVKI